MFLRGARGHLATAVFCWISMLVPIGAQGATNYQVPDRVIVDILNQPPLPSFSLDPTRKKALLIQRSGMPTIVDVAQPILRLAGQRFNPKTNGPVASRLGRTVALSVIDLKTGKSVALDVPAAPDLGDPTWSPDGRRVAFTHTESDGVYLWMSDAETGKSRKVTKSRLNLADGTFVWMPDSNFILCRLIPSSREEPPREAPFPTGPVIQETEGEFAQVRTYQDLLSTPYDEALYRYYLTSQVALVNVVSGSIVKIGEPGLFGSVDVAPNGQYFLVERIVPPFSYAVPSNYFPTEVEIWNSRGRLVRTLASLPLAEDVPIGGVRRGARSHSWVPVKPATLSWVEALDEGDPKKKVEHRDKVMFLTAPFKRRAVEGFRSEFRLVTRSSQGNGKWLESGLALFSEYDRDSQWTRTWLADPLASEKPAPRLLWDRNVYDAYGDPGAPVMAANSAGRDVVLQLGETIFLTGDGASPDGDLPFLDSLDLATFQSTRLFRSEKGSYESAVAVLDPESRTFLTRFETQTQPPNYFIRKVPSTDRQAITDFKDPAPQFRGVTKQLITYWREDGLELSGTLYLPEGYKKGTKLPLVMWAYPREFNDPKTASQVRGSPSRFTTPTGPSHLFLLTQGYAVLDGPAMPIVGENGNDTFVEQLVMNAKAAIDEVVRLGVADRSRIGIGGHSYGAFMTANLLAHSDFFAAGVARSGAYNRTLTPFGFQNEKRTFWEAPDVYFAMSPFMHVDQLDEPILLIHGKADNNSGTFPMQTERLFHALKGLGGKARMVILPDESHGYAARESVLHCLYEMVRWFDTYLKPQE